MESCRLYYLKRILSLSVVILVCYGREWVDAQVSQLCQCCGEWHVNVLLVIHFVEYIQVKYLVLVPHSTGTYHGAWTWYLVPDEDTKTEKK